jgi:hypothetical protein
MQANRQNTRQLAAGASEIMEWFTQGAEWSILNYGPGTLWFSYTPGVDAAPGEVQATKLEAGYSFTDSASAPRALQLSLHAEAGNVTYCLNTNQRYGAGTLPPGAGIPEAPEDGELYGRRNAAWDAVSPGVPEAPLNPTTHGRRGGDGAWIPVLNKDGDTVTGNLVIDDGNLNIDGGRLEIVRPVGTPTQWNLQNLILAHAAKNYNQTLVPGAIAIVFMNNNEVQNGGFRIGKLVLNAFADEFIFQTGAGATTIDAHARHIILDGGDPTETNHAARKAYVDALAAPGAIQTINVIGTGWLGTPQLRYRHLNGGGQVQIVGQIQRAGIADYLPPGVPPTTLCQLPPAYRPTGIGQQIQICACAAGTPADATLNQVIEYGFLQLGTNGDLSFFGHAPRDLAAVPELQGTASIYVSNIFSLTMT